jgi:hypothetical protein
MSTVRITTAFDVTEGETWIDEDGVGWEVMTVNGDLVSVRRVITDAVGLAEFTQKWRRPNRSLGDVDDLQVSVVDHAP